MKVWHSFQDAVEDVTGGNTKVPLREYNSTGAIPIVDQGKTFIGGYTDDEKAFYSGKLPCVIFGDHTKILKFIDFPFALGADGVKVLAPRIESLSPRFLYHYLRSQHLPDAGYSRHFKFLKDINIPVPPLEEQRRIVGLLDRAAEIRRRADAARAKARAIIPALFLDTFGDPATNPKGWPVVTLGDLDGMELRNGISPSKAGKVSGNVLTLSAITRGAFEPSARKDAMFAGRLAAEQTVSKSLFLICRGNGNRALVGQGAFPLMDMPGVAFPDTMIALRLPEHEVAPPYLAAVWSSDHVRAQIDAAAKTTNGTFKISQSGILRFSFPLPPRPLQISFGERVSRLETLARHLDAAAAKAEAMAAGLSAEVFDAGQRKDAADGSLTPC